MWCSAGWRCCSSASPRTPPPTRGATSAQSFSASTWGSSPALPAGCCSAPSSARPRPSSPMISRSRSRQGSPSSALWLRTPSTKPRHYTLQGLLPLSLLNAPYCAQAQTQAVEPGVEALKESGDRLYFGPPKYGRVRTIALPPFLVEALAAHLAAFRPAQDLVFTSPEGSMLRRSNFQRRGWAPARAA